MHLEVVLAHELVSTAGYGTGNCPALIIIVRGTREVIEGGRLLEDFPPSLELPRVVCIRQILGNRIRLLTLRVY